MSNFNRFGLHNKIIKSIDDMGYKDPTPIQELAIPKILEQVDIRASAQTGTGKTAAFMLPIIHLLATQEKKSHLPSALIVVPTRELAMQVAAETKKFSAHLPQIKTVCIYGGVPYPIQKRELSRKYDILIATPGRLLDHMEQKKIDLSQIKVLVLDEADRMLDMGFIDDVEYIASQSPKTRQTLLFSATLDKKVLPFAKRLQKDAVELRVEDDRSAEKNIEKRLYYVDNISHKKRLLEHLLETLECEQTLVFTSTISQADEIADHLEEKGHASGSLHGDMNQRQRTKTINRMRKGDLRVLVATDVAARGIDISTLTHVFNFDLPFQIENFIHRIGRTGRAGAKGMAISFATHREEQLVVKINKMLETPMDCHTVEGMEPQPRKRSPKPFRQGPGRHAPGRKNGFKKQWRRS